MSLRIAASSSLRALRPSLGGLRVAAPAFRSYSTTPEDPKAKAASILEALPGNGPLSKTGIVATSAAGLAYVISNQLYVVNEESILLACFLAFTYGVSKGVAPLYKDYADATVKNISDILNSSRTKHVEAVKERIDSVSQLKDVVDTTKILFEVSKETVKAEAEAFELKQRVDLAAEAKSVLDSWVRYEASVRQREQKQLAETIIANVQKEISNPKFQQQVLAQAIADVEKIFSK